MLVNFQPKTMPGAMKESDPSASAHLSRKTAFSEKFLDRLVNCHPIDSCLDSLQRERLTGFYCFPQLTLAFAGTSAQHRAGHVAKISGLRVAWTKIEDNQLIRKKRNIGRLMWIACLVATVDKRA